MTEKPNPEKSIPDYLAWDGNTYTGEPPEGWYLATDNRWWPSKELISETYDYAEPHSQEPSTQEPYAQAYLDDDQAYGRPYPIDPEFDEPTSADQQFPAQAKPEPLPAPETNRVIDAEPESIELSDLTPQTLLPEPIVPEKLASWLAGEDQHQLPPRPLPRKSVPRSNRGRAARQGITLFIFLTVALFRCATGPNDGGTDTGSAPLPPAIETVEQDLSFDEPSHDGFHPQPWPQPQNLYPRQDSNLRPSH